MAGRAKKRRRDARKAEREDGDDDASTPAPAADGARVTRRLMTLLTTLVNAPQPVPFSEIRESFPDDYAGKSLEAAERMFERDKKLLEELGIPLEWVPADDDGEVDAGGYRVDKNRLFLEELSLEPQEMAVVLLAGSPLLEQEGFPYRQPLRLALHKLRLGSAETEPEDAYVTVNVPIVHGGAAVEKILDALTEGLFRRKTTTIVYRDWKTGQDATRAVDPYGLYCSGGAWYLVGHSHERNAPRQFAVHRIQRATVNAVKPTAPDFDVPRDFRLKDWARRPAWRWEAHAPLTAVIDCAPDVAWLAERKLGAKASPAGEWRRLEVEGVTNVDALADWALGFADRVRAVAPPSLVAAVTSRLEAVLARYGEKT